MSHPVPGHDYSEPTYPSDSPHKEGGHYSPKGKALKKARLNSAQRSIARQLNALRDRPGENHLQRIKRLMK